MYMEDTMWPFPGKVGEYIEAAGAVYRPALGAEGSHVNMSIELALQTMPGAGRHPEVTLLQKLSSLPLLIRLLTNDIPARSPVRARGCTRRSTSATSGGASCSGPPPWSPLS